MAGEFNRYPVKTAIGGTIAVGVVGGVAVGLGLAAAGGLGGELTTLGIGGANTPAAALARVEATIARALANPNTRELAKRFVEHRNKLVDYVRNPLANDNKGILRDALSSGNTQRAANIFRGRVRELTHQVNNFWRQIQ